LQCITANSRERNFKVMIASRETVRFSTLR